MKALINGVKNIGQFFTEVKVELKKCAWPTREELTQSTTVVIVSVALLGIYVAVCDGVVMQLLRVIVR